MSSALSLLEPLIDLHDVICDTVISATETQHLNELSEVERDKEGDTIYAIDAVSEEVFMPFFERLAEEYSFVLIAEGLEGGQLVFPRAKDASAAEWRIILDPIDGTRGLMYQKRSAWILTGVAPNRGPMTGLHDIELAIQTEIPLIKQHLSDRLWASRNAGVNATRTDRVRGTTVPLRLQPSTSKTVAHGFATVSRFFPGNNSELGEIEDVLVRAALNVPQPGKAVCFEDQYISTGGQLYELMAGHDRFIADLRPLVPLRRGLCCHPYDLAAALIASELGIIITDPFGNSLNAPLDTTSEVAWIGYANEHIRRQIEPLLQTCLKDRGWI
jgi:fructose-1,6-bisphosphatase/inositol monophosphatase family enzyme